MARGLLADPDLPNKAREGKEALIFHCVACNQGCFDSIFQMQPAACMVNPRAGKEGELTPEPASDPKKILVIGGGPAGMKAACTAAERGHRVTLMEKEGMLGGQLPLNRSIPGRRELVTAARDLAHNLTALDVEVLLNKEADASAVRALAPDVVVLATGASPILPPMEGIEGANVIQAWDVLAGRRGTGDRVVIVGGNAVGLETALYLAGIGSLSAEVLHFLMTSGAESAETVTALLNKGFKEVTVVEMTRKVGKDIGLTTRWTIMAELRRLGVKVLAGTKALAVKSDGLVVENEEGEAFLPADSVVLASGSRSENGLVAELEGLVDEMHVIGDAKEPRNALEAIKEGYLVGLEV
jgi:2,4-dienoyl-CoA reductase (NADPH2)